MGASPRAPAARAASKAAESGSCGIARSKHEFAPRGEPFFRARPSPLPARPLSTRMSENRNQRGGFRKDGGGRPGKPFKKPFGKKPAQPAPRTSAHEGERIAKVMARAGACSRRDAEQWIEDGRVAVNGKVLTSAAFNVRAGDRVTVDGAPLAARERTRMFLFHKPRGLVTTDKDPEGRETIFDYIAQRYPELPRLVSIGRLDLNTEGLLLLTNDGGLARTLELPATGWLRRYRVRAHGETDQARLDELGKGVSVEGVDYAPIEARLDRQQGANIWLTMGLREGKNREVRRVLGALGLDVNRLIRLSYGPFQLGELAEGAVEEVRGRVLRDQLGPALIEQSGADFDTPMAEQREERPSRFSRDERGPRGARAERGPRDERAPRFARDNGAAPRGRYARNEDEAESPRREKPQQGSRKHVSTLRAERSAAREDGARVKVTRGATQDRKGRAVTVERVTPAAPREDRETRNGRRFADARAPRAKRFGAPNGEQNSDRPARRGRIERSPMEGRERAPYAGRGDNAQRGERPARAERGRYAPHEDRATGREERRGPPRGERRPDRQSDRAGAERPQRRWREDGERPQRRDRAPREGAAGGRSDRADRPQRDFRAPRATGERGGPTKGGAFRGGAKDKGPRNGEPKGPRGPRKPR
ncbi:MAG: pseudouridine synthase [Hyphomicrobiales bacterium]|nr:pseudouridine synthase [Hyphomicrobiales bacterium]